MGPIVLATANPHKVEELRAIFGPAGVALIGLDEAAGGRKLAEPAEVGSTFEANAAIKARSYSQQTGLTCLADDSGLEVDALGGPPARPGVISSHYCTDGREVGMSREQRDRANNERMLRELEGVAPERRGARFVCVMCLADREGVVATVRGVFEGRIGEAPAVPRGANGFGYDPLFLVAPGFERTSAELDPAEKNRLSHRGVAAGLMVERIKALAPNRKSKI